MQRAEMPTSQSSTARPSDRASRSPISVALLAGVACMPIVVSAGFLTDRSDAVTVPGDISVMALRGVLDGAAPNAVRPPARAGY